MESKIINAMGSVVREGFHCKPENPEPDKPIMFYKWHLFICMGDRCNSKYNFQNISELLRELLKKLGYHQGENRIKITRTYCFGACRYKSVAVLYSNIFDINGLNNCIWLKQIDKFSLEQWKIIFDSIVKGISLDNILDNNHLIEMKLYDSNKSST